MMVLTWGKSHQWTRHTIPVNTLSIVNMVFSIREMSRVHRMILGKEQPRGKLIQELRVILYTNSGISK